MSRLPSRLTSMPDLPTGFVMYMRRKNLTGKTLTLKQLVQEFNEWKKNGEKET